MNREMLGSLELDTKTKRTKQKSSDTEISKTEFSTLAEMPS